MAQRSRLGSLVLAFGTASALQTAAAAEIASTFDADSDGWTVTSGATLVHAAMGGNPSGHIQVTDTASGVFSAVAPAKFLGDLTAFDGGRIALDLSQVVDNAGSLVAAAGQLTISGPGGTATVDLLCSAPTATWTTLEMPLDGDSWGVPAITWSAILGNVTNVDFVADALNGTGDTLGIDNFLVSDTPLPTAACDTIRFQSAGPACAIDDLPITTQYRRDCGVRFGIDSDDDGFLDSTLEPALEAVGGSGDGPFGFNNNDEGQLKDTADPGFEQQLGGFFLRGEVPLAPVTLVILYDSPVAAASGEIWDIDGSVVEGTEQWRVEAMGASYAAGTDPDDVVAAVESPVGFDTTLDGRPWTFSFSRAAADVHALRLTHIGTDTTGVGLAFDNFSPATAAANSLPVLSEKAMLALAALLTLIAVVRLRARGVPGDSAES